MRNNKPPRLASRTTKPAEEAAHEQKKRSILLGGLLRIVKNPDVELLINLVILGNLVTLAMQDPLEDERQGRNAVLWWISE